MTLAIWEQLDMQTSHATNNTKVFNRYRKFLTAYKHPQCLEAFVSVLCLIPTNSNPFHHCTAFQSLISYPVILAVSAESRIKEVETQANILLDRLKPMKLLEENLSRNLSEIKELINQARKQAASVSAEVAPLQPVYFMLWIISAPQTDIYIFGRSWRVKLPVTLLNLLRTVLVPVLEFLDLHTCYCLREMVYSLCVFFSIC